jgi:hypothetical protein
MRRRSVLLSIVPGVVTGALAVGRTTEAQEASPDAMTGHPLIGTWIVDRNPADPSVGAAGVWTVTGPDTADFTLIAIFAEDGGSYFVVRGSLAVDAAGDSATATISQTHVAADGTVLDQMAQGSANYLRLRVEPQDAVGQPLAGFPAWTSASVATPTP